MDEIFKNTAKRALQQNEDVRGGKKKSVDITIDQKKSSLINRKKYKK